MIVRSFEDREMAGTVMVGEEVVPIVFIRLHVSNFF
jgi:hypothetical protein